MHHEADFQQEKQYMTVALGTKGAGLLVAVAEGSCIGIAGAGGEQHDGGQLGVSRRHSTIKRAFCERL